MLGEPVFDHIACPDTEHDVAVQLRFPPYQIAHDIGAHHLFVNGIGLDVFAVEADARIWCTHALQRVDQPSRTGRRRDLRRREMPDRRAAHFAVQPK